MSDTSSSQWNISQTMSSFSILKYFMSGLMDGNKIRFPNYSLLLLVIPLLPNSFWYARRSVIYGCFVYRPMCTCRQVHRISMRNIEYYCQKTQTRNKWLPRNYFFYLVNRRELSIVIAHFGIFFLKQIESWICFPGGKIITNWEKVFFLLRNETRC